MTNLDVSRRLLSVKETASRLGVSQESVRRRIRDGSIPAVKLGSGPKAPFRIDPQPGQSTTASGEGFSRATKEKRSGIAEQPRDGVHDCP
jgi:excisionase family DNA binding protein